MNPKTKPEGAARAEWELRRAARRQQHRKRQDELADAVKNAVADHGRTRQAVHSAERDLQALRDERDRHLDVVLAKIDRRAEVLPSQAEHKLRESAGHIATSGHEAAMLPAVASFAPFVNPDGTLNAEAVKRWKALVTDEARASDHISTRSRKTVERELKAAAQAVDEARAAEREAKEAVQEARRRLHEFESPA